jgi:hypothetical protein
MRLDLHGHHASDLVTELADLAVVLDLARGLLEADLEELAPLLTQVFVELIGTHLAQLVGVLGVLGHALASVDWTSAPGSSRMTKRVGMGSLCAANRIASFAV